MRDRGMMKWRPFNAVIPSSELLKRDTRLDKPNLSVDEIEKYEELLKFSMYSGASLFIVFLYKNEKMTIEDVVTKLDPINKNIYFKNNPKINFSQIYEVKVNN